jgi:pyrroline-5-carboxylate reductase
VNVPELPGILHEKIAGEDVAVVLDDCVAVAGCVHSTGGGLAATKALRNVVEEADVNFVAVRPPNVEQIHQELPVLLRREGKFIRLPTRIKFR